MRLCVTMENVGVEVEKRVVAGPMKLCVQSTADDDEAMLSTVGSDWLGCRRNSVVVRMDRPISELWRGCRFGVGCLQCNRRIPGSFEREHQEGRLRLAPSSSCWRLELTKIYDPAENDADGDRDGRCTQGARWPDTWRNDGRSVLVPARDGWTCVWVTGGKGMDLLCARFWLGSQPTPSASL